MKVEPHPITGIPVIKQFEIKRRILRKCTLANGYGLYYDLFANKYYVHPDAEKVSKDKWRGCVVGGDYYIYLQEDVEEEDVHPAILEREEYGE